MGVDELGVDEMVVDDWGVDEVGINHLTGGHTRLNLQLACIRTRLHNLTGVHIR